MQNEANLRTYLMECTLDSRRWSLQERGGGQPAQSSVKIPLPCQAAVLLIGLLLSAGIAPRRGPLKTSAQPREAKCSKRDTRPPLSPSGTASGKVSAFWFLSFHRGQRLFCQPYLEHTGPEHPGEIWLLVPICDLHKRDGTASLLSKRRFKTSLLPSPAPPPHNHTGAPNPPKQCPRPPLLTPPAHPFPTFQVRSRCPGLGVSNCTDLG